MFSIYIRQLEEGLETLRQEHLTLGLLEGYFQLNKATTTNVVKLLLIIAIIIFSGFNVSSSDCPLCFFLLIETKARKTYQLNVRVSRKINALLVLEKARTGKSMPEIVEDIFREYSNNRKK